MAAGPGRHDRRRRQGGAAAGFTLAELMTVLAILGLLVAVLWPSLQAAREHAYRTICQSNMQHLVQAMHTHSSEQFGTIPKPGRWIPFVSSSGAGGALKCPKEEYTDEVGGDEGTLPRDAPNIADLYEVQYDHTHVYHFRYLVDLIQDQGDFYQMNVYYPSDELVEIYDSGTAGAHRVYHEWREDIWQHIRAAIRIEFGPPIVLTPLIPPLILNNQRGGSCHWLCLGDGGRAGEFREDEILIHLTGTDISVPEPNESMMLRGCPGIPGVPPTTVVASYGMNNRVPCRMPRGGQLLLGEYNKAIIDVDGDGANEDQPADGDLENGELADRHFGKVNVVTVDGSVRAMSKGDLAWQLEPLLEGQSPGERLWDP